MSSNLAELDRRLTELENPKTVLSHVVANNHGGGQIKKVVKEVDKEGGEDAEPAKFMAAKARPSHDKKAPGFMEAGALSDCANASGCADGSVASGSFAVHLASYKHMQYLQRGWTELHKQFPTLLANQVPRAKRFTRDDGTVYIRLKAGPFETKQQAYDLCNKLKARQAYCALSRFDGIDLGGFVDL